MCIVTFVLSPGWGYTKGGRASGFGVLKSRFVLFGLSQNVPRKADWRKILLVQYQRGDSPRVIHTTQ